MEEPEILPSPIHHDVITGSFMNFNEIKPSVLKRFVHKMGYGVTLIIVGLLLLFGGWCLPPKMMEKVIERLKSKSIVENIFKDKSGPNI